MSLATLIPIMAFSPRYSHYQRESAYCFLRRVKMYYNYHARNMERIKNGELIGFEFADGEFELVLLFSTYPYTRPIRPHSVFKYEEILKNFKGV